jgi:hypothetical protein
MRAPATAHGSLPARRAAGRRNHPQAARRPAVGDRPPIRDHGVAPALVNCVTASLATSTIDSPVVPHTTLVESGDHASNDEHPESLLPPLPSRSSRPRRASSCGDQPVVRRRHRSRVFLGRVLRPAEAGSVRVDPRVSKSPSRLLVKTTTGAGGSRLGPGHRSGKRSRAGSTTAVASSFQHGSQNSSALGTRRRPSTPAAYE